MDFDYHVLIQYSGDLLLGLVTTLWAIGITLGIAVLIGLLACIASLSASPFLRAIAKVYTDVFRVLPDIVLVFWVYYCFPLVFNLRLSALGSGILALSLTMGAFLGEIFRAGILTIPVGQLESAHALGLGPVARWSKIILPQAIRRMLPAFMNSFTELLKHTTLLAGIGVTELTYQAYTLGSRTFKQLEFLTAIAVLYFAVIFPLSILARHAEVRIRQRTAS